MVVVLAVVDGFGGVPVTADGCGSGHGGGAEVVVVVVACHRPKGETHCVHPG